MARAIYIALLFMFCGQKPLLDGHVFYAGSMKDGQEISKMNDWQVVSVDSSRVKHEKVYVFHYKEMELK